MDSKQKHTLIIIGLIIINIFVSIPLAVLIIPRTGIIGVFLVCALSAYLMYHILLRIQSRKRRMALIISHYSYSAAWALTGVYMIFYAFPAAARQPGCPLTGLGEMLFGILSFAIAIVTAFSLTISIGMVRRNKIKAAKTNSVGDCESPTEN